jgi:hypothetical protein
MTTATGDLEGAVTARAPVAVSREEVEAAVGTVMTLPLEPGFSTTNIVDEIVRRLLDAAAAVSQGLGYSQQRS